MVVEHDWPSGIERLESDAIVARKRVRDRRAEDALDVGLPDLGFDVEAAHDDGEPFLAVALFQRRRESSRGPNRCQFLVGDDHEPGCRFERLDHHVGARHVEYDVAIVARRGFDQHSNAGRINRRRARAIRRREERQSGAGVADEPGEKGLVQPMHVLERVDDREARLRAEIDGGVAVGQVQIDESVEPRSLWDSAVATLVATVVVPTPPLAPMNAKTSPIVLGACAVVTRPTAALSSGAVTGAVRNSVTPARIASSISAGSSAAATSTTPVAGCCRRSMPTVGGSIGRSRMSRMTREG